MKGVLSLFEKCVKLNRNLPEDAYVAAMNVESPGRLADLIASTIDLDAPGARSCWKSWTPSSACSWSTSC